MSKKEISQQSERLSLFVAKTGYSISEFSRQCNIASPRTMTKIVTDGIAPTSKVLDKIITRFPQLNHDWVILGYGEMIIPGMTKQPASGTSVLKSSGASFQQISDKQIETSFGINELARKVEQAMALNAQTNQLLTNKIEQMSIVVKKTVEDIQIIEENRHAHFLKMRKLEDLRIETLDAERKEFITTQFEAQILAVKTVLQNNMKASKEMVTNFDIERKKRNQENAEKQTKEILTCLANGKDRQSKQINNGIELGLKTFKDLVKKTTSETMTEFLNFLQGNESAKKTVSELGKHTKVSNPKPSR